MKLAIHRLLLLAALWAPWVFADQAAIAMPDQFSAAAASEVLKEGGNAVDAAVAAGFVLAVTLPEAGNIGGGGFMLLYHQGNADFLDYRETAPAAATRDMYLDEKGEVIKYLSLFGGRSSGTPGTVAGLWIAHQKYGSLPWKRLLAPAITLANEGFIVPQGLFRHASSYLHKLEKLPNAQIKQSANFARYFGQLRDAELFRQPELGKTLTVIAEKGPDGFYRGEVANLIAAQMRRSGGLISTDDLKNYTALWRQPVTANWRDFTVLSSPPPSSGGAAVVQLLKMKQALDPLFSQVKHNSVQYIHLTAEMAKRVYADRANYMGDPDFVKVPVADLINDDYILARAKEVNSQSISETEKVMPGLKESNDTTHYSIIDRWGNAVSNTYTLNTSFGSGVVVEGAGFLLNNEMDDFSAKPGIPNFFGVIGGAANEIAAGKRMLSSMSPTILLGQGKVKLVVGSPGGSTIITSVYQTIVNAIDFNMPLNEAVSSVRFHHQLLPRNRIVYNPKLPGLVVKQLSQKGYDMKSVGYLGDVQAILASAENLQAFSDLRGRGRAAVIEFADK